MGGNPWRTKIQPLGLLLRECAAGKMMMFSHQDFTRFFTLDLPESRTHSWILVGQVLQKDLIVSSVL